MKTTFSCFPGMFENLTPLNIIKKKMLSNINFIRMRWKIIDDYCLYFLIDLFGIKLIILRSKSSSQIGCRWGPKWRPIRMLLLDYIFVITWPKWSVLIGWNCWTQWRRLSESFLIDWLMKTTFKKWGRNWFCGGGGFGGLLTRPAQPA